MDKNTIKLFFAISFLVVFGLAVAGSVFAYPPLVPCGRQGQEPCSQCDFLKLGKNLSDFVLFFIIPVVGTLLIVIAGFMILLGGARPALISQGKSIFWGVIVGILIISTSWLVVNFLLKSLAGDSDIADNWYKLECKATIKTITGVPADKICAYIDPGNNKYACINNSNEKAKQNKCGEVAECQNKNCQSLDPNSCGKEAEKIGPTNTNCGDFSLVCSKTAESCPILAKDPTLPSGKPSWAYLIPEVAKDHPIPGADTAKFLEAVMKIESNGVLNVESNSTPPSCGLMQLQAGTAARYKNKCGISHDITCGWLKGTDLRSGETKEMVAKASICMAAEYLKAIKISSCYGGELRDLAAGYNGGGGCTQSDKNDNALALSVSCGDQSTAENKYAVDCSNRPTLRYECLWENLGHTSCNEGFKETRSYTAKFNACYY